MTVNTLERFPEEGPGFRSDDRGTLHFEPHSKPRTGSRLGGAALEGVMRVEDIELPWVDTIAQSDDGTQQDPLLAWEESITHKREPWEDKGAFRMHFNNPEDSAES